MRIQPPAFARTAQDRALGAMALLLALTLAAGLVPLIQRVFCPVQIQQTEAYMVDRALLFFSGENLYPDPARGGPYIFTAYPPFYFFLQAVLLKITGGLWLAGRFLSMAGYLGCGLLMFAWGWSRWGKIPALSVSLLFLLSPTWATWGSMVRPDTLSLLFHFTAFLLLFRDSLGKTKKMNAWGLAGAGLLSGAAVCVKQTTVSLWLAYGLYALIKKEWKKLGYFAAGCLAPVLALVIWEQWVTYGMFLRHTGFWLDTGYDWGALEYFFVHGFLKEAGWMVLAVILTLAFKAPGLLPKCQVLFSSIQLLSLGRNGGAENYILEFSLYGILLAAEGYWAAGERPRRGWAGWAPVLFMLAGYVSQAGTPWPSAPSVETIQVKREAAQRVQSPGPYLLLDMDLLLMAGHRIWYQPVEYQYLFVKGRWDAEPLMKDIRFKKFTSIELYDIPRQYLLPPKIVSEIEKSYHLADRKYGRLWYLPN